MAKTLEKGIATEVFENNGDTVVKYHDTEVIRFNRERIVLRNDGWETNTTKNRINQASMTYGLDLRIHQYAWEWYVSFQGKTIPFDDGMILER